jgi:hypothetical protein
METLELNQRAFAAYLVAVALSGMLLCTAGCATCFPAAKLTFRIVDANGGLPLDAVQTEHLSTSRVMMGIPFFAGESGQFQLPPTQADGLCVADGLCSDLSHQFFFTKVGFHRANAAWTAGGEMLTDLSPNDPHSEHQFHTAVRDRGGIYIIVMYPDTVAVMHYEPKWILRTDPPRKILKKAEQAYRSERHSDGADWHRQPGALRAYQNQYGDYRILWIARDEARHGYQWDWYDTTGTYTSGAKSNIATQPDIEQLPHWLED